MTVDSSKTVNVDSTNVLTLASDGPAPLPFTGERYTPTIDGAIRREHHHRYLAALEHCRGKNVLDVASGEGYGTHLLGRVADRVVGLDIDEASVVAARERYIAENVTFVVGDAIDLPFADQSFDVVTSFETLEHIERWETFLAEVARVLKPEGTLLISTPNRDVYSDGYKNPFHVHEFDREEFREALLRHFSTVQLLEQRNIIASVLIPEHAPASNARSFFETADGTHYEQTAALPQPRYFLAVAHNAESIEVGESLLIDCSASEASKEPAVPDARSTLLEQRLERRLAQSRRQMDLLRRSTREWAATAAMPAEITTPPEADGETAHSPRNERSGARAVFRQRLRRMRTRVRRRLAQGLAEREFDANYYLGQNPDVAKAGVDPFVHYMDTGWREGRDPSPTFSTQHYLSSNPDVRTLEINPLLHFVLYGRKEGRSPHPAVADNDLTDETKVPSSPLPDATPPAARRAELIAFYLPQFHPIPENDEWWGEGFTEWTNVRATVPQFVGHNQPRVPGELGYYNLLDKSVQRRQIELARLYGIGGFCFYFYWFDGKRLLEKPVEAWLEDKSLDFPFCICWANENWTRRWDGKDTEVLIAQRHSPEDDLAFIEAVAPYLRDKRYIRVDGKPILVVYRPSLLPSARDTALRWRDWCRKNGIGEIHLAYTQSFDRVDPAVFGFDAAIEFPPNNYPSTDLTDFVKAHEGMERLRVHDWRSVYELSLNYDQPAYRIYRGVCPGWDNAPRRKNGGVVFVNNSPERYRDWLRNAISDTEARIEQRSERLVFINAWNEWAEGSYLEPDRQYGYAWLRATREAVEAPIPPKTRSVVIVSHDAHPHGAQYLALHLARAYSELQFDVHMIVLGDGPLLSRFEEVARVTRLHRQMGEQRLLESLVQLRGTAGAVAIANTTVSGWIVPLLKRAGFTTLSLVHEMPSVLTGMDLAREAKDIARSADLAVFAAPIIQDGFETFAGQALRQAAILPQGLIRNNPFIDDPAGAHQLVTERHGLDPQARIVLSVAYADHRKGPDLWLDAATRVVARNKDIVFLWIGHFAPNEESKLRAEVTRRKLDDNVRFLGFVAEPMEYYAAASVYALTSREDPFPNVVLESTSVGVPVVAFEGTTGASEFIVSHGGRLVPAFDCDAFAAALEDLAAQPRQPARAVPSIRQYAQDLLGLATRRPRVSVVVPNYNYARLLERRLEGILGQSWRPYEVIVLDDGSTDDSASVIKSFANRHPEGDLRVILGNENSGSVFRQWQKGIALCRGDLVWIAEADDMADPDFLETLADRFSNPGVVLAYCQSRQIDEAGRTIANSYLDYTADISDRWQSDYGCEGSREIAEALAVKNTIPNVSAVLFRRTALQAALTEIGTRLYDYRVAGDWLVYMHVMLQGRVEFVARPLNAHRRHQNSATSRADAERHLREVQEMQDLARQLVTVSPQTLARASAWLEHVRRYLKLAA